MKKVRFFLTVMLIIASVNFVGCKNNRYDDVKPSNIGYDFEAVTGADYDYMISKFDTSKVKLLYSQAFINGYFDEICPDSIRVNEMEVLFQVVTDTVDYVYAIRHKDPKFNPGAFEVDSIPGHWGDCAPLDLSQVSMTFGAIMRTYYDMNIPKAHSDVVVLRKPTNPKYGILYLIGNPEAGIVTVLSATDGSFVEDVTVKSNLN